MRAILVDDAVLLREGMARLLDDDGIAVVAQLGDAEHLPACVDDHRPDAVVIDIRMPPTFTVEGLQAALALRRTHPEIGVLVLSQHLESHYATKLLSGDGGGVGYLLKHRVTDPVQFAAALRTVAKGGSAIDEEVVTRLLNRRRVRTRLDELTEREQHVLALMAQGRSNQAIGRQLFLHAKTVETHVSSIFTKLLLLPEPEQNRRVAAVLQYLQAGDGQVFT